MSLNLASQPFVNSRPVRRLVLVLWCLSVVVITADLFFYARHFSGRQARLDRLDALAGQESREQQRLAELERELAGFDVDWQNRQVEFLNLRIAERVFPWSRLFDRLAEALPGEVRLKRLTPKIERLSGPRGGPAESVRLEIRAEARDEEAILEFLGLLFEHDAFGDPNLSSESRKPRSKVTEFALSTNYLPARAAPPEQGQPAPPAAEEKPPVAGEEGEE